MKVDLNCDLGEAEPKAATRALMRWVTSANVACGGHAGSVETMAYCVSLAKRCGVHVGAHPGPFSRSDFGRAPIKIRKDDLRLLLIQQVSALEKIAKREGVRLHHIKLHGGLYHAVEGTESLAQCYIELVRRYWPKLKIYARSGGTVAREAHPRGVEVWEEAYADRAYDLNGNLVPRENSGAVLTDAAAVVRQALSIIQTGTVPAISGDRVPVSARTICVHADTPGAPRLARAIRQALKKLHGGN